MSLLRLAFWLALLVLLLPTDAQQQARFSNFANTAMERLTTFCDRNGRTCAVGAEAWATFLKKAEFGIRLVGDLLGAGGRHAPTPVPSAADPPRDKGTGRADPRGSLSPPELYRPPWRRSARPGGG